MNENSVGMSRQINLVILLAVMILFSGCSHMMHPQAEEYLKQAKGQIGVETALTLIGMMEASAQQAMTETGESAGLTTLHDQFHALRHSFCEATDAQTKTAAYDKAVTIKKRDEDGLPSFVGL